MAKGRGLRQCRTSGDFLKIVRAQGGTVSQGGRHTIAQSPSGKGRVPIPRHGNQQLAIGTRKSITKMLLALGFAVFPFICVVSTSLIIIGAVK